MKDGLVISFLMTAKWCVIDLWVFGSGRVAFLKTLSGATRTAINYSKDSEEVVMF
jgi:hypothetical protein